MRKINDVLRLKLDALHLRVRDAERNDKGLARVHSTCTGLHRWRIAADRAGQSESDDRQRYAYRAVADQNRMSLVELLRHMQRIFVTNVCPWLCVRKLVTKRASSIPFGELASADIDRYCTGPTKPRTICPFRLHASAMTQLPIRTHWHSCARIVPSWTKSSAARLFGAK